MIPYDLLLAFVLALVAWALVCVARALRSLTGAVYEQSEVLTQLAEQLHDNLLTPED